MGVVDGITATLTAEGRGLAGWGDDVTVEAKLAVLDERTKAMDRELGQLQTDLKSVERRAEARLSEVADALRRDIADVRAEVGALRGETVRTDASALPLIVLGVVLSGIAADAAAFQLWFWSLVLVGATFAAAVLASRIVREWRRRAQPS